MASRVEAARDVRVLTVDDHPPFREAARAVVAATPGFESVGEAVTGEDAPALVARDRPDMVLLDVRLPGIDGYEAARRIAEGWPEVVIVLVSAVDEAVQGDIAARCGAVAFVRKQELRPELLVDIWATHAPVEGRAG